VLVYITQYHSKRIYILGEVDRPGEYAMSQPLTLMDAIILAGGLDLPAARYGYLHRPLKTGNIGPPMPNTLREPEVARPGTEVFRVDLQPLKEGGVLAQNIALKAGDVFVVPKRKMEVFYVIGEVKGPGSYEIPIGSRLLVSQAISASGGPVATAKASKGLLVRTDADGNRTEIKIDYLAILHGQQPDVELRGNDIVFIPGSQIKTIAFGLLGTIPTMARRGVVRNGQ
jgi:polysaccharide export outer membrane protein